LVACRAKAVKKIYCHQFTMNLPCQNYGVGWVESEWKAKNKNQNKNKCDVMMSQRTGTGPMYVHVEPNKNNPSLLPLMLPQCGKFPLVLNIKSDPNMALKFCWPKQ